MAIAEVVLGAFLKVLFQKLASGELIRLARSIGIYSELEKWNSILCQIQAVLVDAGLKHLVNTSIQLWLNKLHHLAYDIDDVLDDLATEAMRHQLNQQSHACTSKVLKFIPTKFRALIYGRKMISKLDKITTKLDSLVKEISLLGLISNVERSNTTIQTRSEETSLVDVSEIVGREGDIEALLKDLLANESFDKNFSTVSIVGLGGIGKTTLAQILYNNGQIKKHFELTSWVCVSDDFDVFQISKTIFKDVGGGDKTFENLNQLQVALSKQLSKKKFLIVLDDVWNEYYAEWELLQRPFAVGAHGSKIMVTTRKNEVASVMNSVQSYSVKLLSDEEALSMLAQHALGVRNFNLHPTFVLHGEDIMKKCDGLPLALKTIGRVLRTKTSEKEWEELLNSEIWNSHNESKILPALRLSYYDLPPHLKRMFAYCCLFPKDYTFTQDELVLLWIAEGFLTKSVATKEMESIGRDYFKELVSRSFFQRLSNGKSEYTMHDLLNDLARSVAGEFIFMLGEEMDIDDRNDVLEKFRHFSVIRQEYGVYRKFKALERARRLRTFLAMPVKDNYYRSFYLSNKVLTQVLPRLTFLRVLSLANYSISKVPESIGSLKHVRYLNFSRTKITCLPEQIGDLYNLQSLLVSSCHQLSSLPRSFVKLINLRHLDISNTPKLNETPIGIGGLTNLQTLSKVIIGGASAFKVSDLKDLLHLQGQLSIKKLNKVKNATQAKEANLKLKEGLLSLELEWSGDVCNDTQNEIVHYEVLEGLRPGNQLMSLKIMYYMGTEFPSWVGDSSLVCLTQLTLCGCRSCICIPTLGHLPLLKKLFVESLNELKRIGPELLGHADSCYGIAFPSLEVLGIKDMECWEEWLIHGRAKDGTARWFPHLHEISIKNCPKLVVVINDSIPSLKVLHVEGCSVRVLRSMVGVCSSIVRLTLLNLIGLTHLDGKFAKRLRKVEYLSISKCDNITNLWESEVHIPVSLKTLKVSGCVKLVSLVKMKVNSVISGMSFIREVEICNCPKLEGYDCPSSIEKLDISSCDSMTSLTFPPKHDLSSTLRVLNLQSCDNLEVNWVFSNLLSSLGQLVLFNVSNVRLIPEGCLVHLTHLEIWDCKNIESIPENGFGFLPLLCLRSFTIKNCKNIKSIPHKHLQSLSYLDQMWISVCPSMDKAFPSGLWPPKLRFLTIGGLEKGMCEWGMQHFPTSLVQLCLYGYNKSGVVRFATESKEEEDMMRRRRNSLSPFLLPSSLTYLFIAEFEELESVSKGMKHLTSLEELIIRDCPKLKDLPETLLPSLLNLSIKNPSNELGRKCRKRKGKYWPTISQIPLFELQ